MPERRERLEDGMQRLGEGAERVRRTIGSPTLFAIVYTSLASAVYFLLGAVAERALGLTPFVFLAAGLFFLFAAMTYVEGASLHQDRGGSTVFARYAFNELWSFVAGWAILLDYTILIAVTAFSATHYLGALHEPMGRGSLELILALGIIVYVAVRNVIGFSRTRARRIAVLVGIDIVIQLALIVLGLFAFFSFDTLLDPIDLGSSPSWEDVVFALGIASVVFTGLESASGLAGEVAIGRRGLKRLVASASLTVGVIYVGVAVVALTALPVVDGSTELSTRYLEAPVLGIADSFEREWLADGAMYVVAVAAVATLVAASNSAMLGLSRLAYSLSTNRQIPSAIGRLHPTRATPYVVITIAAALAGALVSARDLDFLIGLLAFGALLALTIAHLSIIVLRFREPDRDRPYRIPLSLRVRGRDVPVPALLGVVLSASAWLSVVILHTGARYVGLAWMAVGLTLYLGYRTTQGKPVFKRVVVPEGALRGVPEELEYGSILVPLFGTDLDVDIVQTAGRLAGPEHDDFDDTEGAVIEVLWVFEVPMALPIDARLPDWQLKQARAALARAKAVGEEYEGVEVATATVRARRKGQAIVEEAKRRGVEAIVLGAEEPSRIRGGALLGGRGGPLDNFLGDVTKYVIAKAPCQVIITAPPERDGPQPGAQQTGRSG